VFTSGASLQIRMRVHAHRPIDDFVFGIGIYGADGTRCYATNTDVEGGQPRAFNGVGFVSFVIDHLDLADGTYKVDVAVHRKNGAPYDYHRLLHTIRVTTTSRKSASTDRLTTGRSPGAFRWRAWNEDRLHTLTHGG